MNRVRARRFHLHRGSFRTLGLVGLIALVHPAELSAQPMDFELRDVESLLAFFPQARTAPAPNVIAEGVRVSYQGAGAVIGGPGQGGGGGVFQYDIVSRDNRQILAHLNFYTDIGGGPMPAGVDYGRGYPGIGPFWINPSFLVGAEQLSRGNLSVTRFAKNVAGNQAEVVRFQTATSNGRHVLEFSANSGLLVFVENTAGNSSQQITLLNLRTLNIPWARSRAPNWVRPGATVRYAGTQTTRIPPDAVVNNRADAVFGVAQAAAFWSLMQAASALDGRPTGGGFRATGPAQISAPLWLPQAALSLALDPNGVRIDVDPITGIEIYLGRGPDGGAILQEVSPVFRITSSYHPTLGVLHRSVQELQQPANSITVDVVRTTPDAELQALAGQPPLPEDPTPPPNDAGVVIPQPDAATPAGPDATTTVDAGTVGPGQDSGVGPGPDAASTAQDAGTRVGPGSSNGAGAGSSRRDGGGCSNVTPRTTPILWVIVLFGLFRRRVG